MFRRNLAQRELELGRRSAKKTLNEEYELFMKREPIAEAGKRLVIQQKYDEGLGIPDPEPLLLQARKLMMIQGASFQPESPASYDTELDTELDKEDDFEVTYRPFSLLDLKVQQDPSVSRADASFLPESTDRSTKTESVATKSTVFEYRDPHVENTPELISDRKINDLVTKYITSALKAQEPESPDKIFFRGEKGWMIYCMPPYNNHCYRPFSSLPSEDPKVGEGRPKLTGRDLFKYDTVTVGATLQERASLLHAPLLINTLLGFVSPFNEGVFEPFPEHKKSNLVDRRLQTQGYLNINKGKISNYRVPPFAFREVKHGEDLTRNDQLAHNEEINSLFSDDGGVCEMAEKLAGHIEDLNTELNGPNPHMASGVMVKDSLQGFHRKFCEDIDKRVGQRAATEALRPENKTPPGIRTTRSQASKAPPRPIYNDGSSSSGDDDGDDPDYVPPSEPSAADGTPGGETVPIPDMHVHFGGSRLKKK